MKLTNQQIEAIISVERQRINNINSEARKKLEQDKSVIAEAKRICKIGNSIQLEIRQALYVDEFSEKKVINALVSERHTEQYFDEKKLRNKIILCSIDANDVEELKNKLGVSF